VWYVFDRESPIMKKPLPTRCSSANGGDTRTIFGSNGQQEGAGKSLRNVHTRKCSERLQR
jgi:hypothetical protein